MRDIHRHAWDPVWRKTASGPRLRFCRSSSMVCRTCRQVRVKMFFKWNNKNYINYKLWKYELKFCLDQNMYLNQTYLNDYLRPSTFSFSLDQVCIYMFLHLRIILLFDANKLDISDEFRRSIEAIHGYEDKVRIILNKADQVDHQVVF